MPSILVINPNSSQSITDEMKPNIRALEAGHNLVKFSFFTAPSGPKSIDDEQDAAVSASHCLPRLLPLLSQYDGFLVACYSKHPLVEMLRNQNIIKRNKKIVGGIFEASVSTCLLTIPSTDQFGIISTVNAWVQPLTDAVKEYLGGDSARFVGVETVGLNAADLRYTPSEELKRRVIQAVTRLIDRGKVGAICLGCAGMVNIREILQETLVSQLGEEAGSQIKVVDGVIAGAAWIDAAIRLNM